ncbi:hypothetical protein Q2T40_12365 [Winogradskyella maritima]|uniref:TlpA family protein disulfide reductase n=1 Tax=Winogradskyella maritima TaxID=1517766 RepID=A0ABV8AH88_9FLAO|nr:hypothetical protein [Winogradskyella maritima]
MRYFALYLVSVLSVIGCSEKDTNHAYLGGEITNPKSDVVILVNPDGKTMDTVALDANNRFIYKIEEATAGIYSFRHGGEYQVVIIEPKDSLMLRLNTTDFDESLVYTGEGARKNNYFLRTFLENEKESRKLVKYSNKEPEEFLAFINERHAREIKAFNDYIAKKDISEFSKGIIQANINYHNYADKEIYPFAYFGNNKLVHVMDLPEDFYDYRTSIDYNSKHLSELYDYNRFMFSHVDNLALNQYYKDKAYHSTFDRHELSYNMAKIDLIDSLIEDSEIKNNLLKYKTREFINHSIDDSEIAQVLGYYLERSTSEDDKIMMQNHVNSIKKLRPGRDLPDLMVYNINREEFKISELVNQPTLIYFWSSNNIMHYRTSHYRVKELRENYPEMDFMSININDNSEQYWAETLQKYKFSLEDEYRFKNLKEALRTLAVNYVYKVIIVDKDGDIVHPNVNIYSDDFEILLQDMKLKKALSI